MPRLHTSKWIHERPCLSLVLAMHGLEIILTVACMYNPGRPLGLRGGGLPTSESIKNKLVELGQGHLFDGLDGPQTDRLLAQVCGTCRHATLCQCAAFYKSPKKNYMIA
jgi:hypothetical protein